ncbi:MAG: hypothetical protein WCJ29_05980 [bacterium]
MSNAASHGASAHGSTHGAAAHGAPAHGGHDAHGGHEGLEPVQVKMIMLVSFIVFVIVVVTVFSYASLPANASIFKSDKAKNPIILPAAHPIEVLNSCDNQIIDIFIVGNTKCR